VNTRRTEIALSIPETRTKEQMYVQNNNNLMEEVIERSNLKKALKRVKSNKGAPGTDDMQTEELYAYLKKNWAQHKEELLEGAYKPSPVRRVGIPKLGGGVRQLGIPTVLDRFIQQAIQQVLTRIFDPQFSKESYGFRPKHSARQAVELAQKHIQGGKHWVVDMDLEKFFDIVNHDILMYKLSREVKDRRVLRIIRRYLESGVMLNGVCVRMKEGTPQGVPLSPLLANIMLNDLDKELSERGHSFVRYADDCNIYVSSKRAGQRVFASISRFIKDKLRLQVNEGKSAVDAPWKRKFLGFSF
jgi:RNA-directed DNA polymerase